MSDKNLLTKGGITKTLIVFTLPVLFALFLQVTYGLVDMLVVGNFGSIADVSAVSTGSQLISTLTALCTGLAMGTTILIGQKKGEGSEKEIAPIITNSTILFLFLSFVIMGLILTFRTEVLNIVNTPDDARVQTANYIFISAVGIPMIFSYNVLGSVFRGLGDSKTPLIAVGIACGANIIGDLILVAILKMGSAGAAIATILSQTISVIASIWIIKKRSLLNYDIRSTMFKVDTKCIRKVISLGSPIALQSVLTSISFLFITIIVNKFGVIFSAAVGVTEKLIGIIMLVPLAFMQSMSVYVAQNFGARDLRRVKRGVFIGILISLSFGIVMAAVSYFYGRELISIFNSDSDVVESAYSYLKAYSLDTLLVPVLFCLTGLLNGCGKTLYVMIHGIVGAIFIRLALAYFFSTIEPISLFRIGLATPAGTSVQIVMCIVFSYITQRELRRLNRQFNA